MLMGWDGFWDGMVFGLEILMGDGMGEEGNKADFCGSRRIGFPRQDDPLAKRQ